MKHAFANRIKNLPPYLFAEIDRIRTALAERGVDIIDLSIGDPDLPTPQPIVDTMIQETRNSLNHQYPSYVGSPAFREMISKWMKDRFHVDVCKREEVIALIGSKEGIAHFPLAFINPGDLGLIPDPGYPVYSTSIEFAGGDVYRVPLKKENHFLPVLEDIPTDIAKRAKIFFLNYPNNPTSATADRKFFESWVRFGKEYEIILAHDAAYTEVTMGGSDEPLSLLEVPGAKDIAIEFHSMSKTFNMTGWRVGFAVGHRDLISGLAKIKTNTDSGVFNAIQKASMAGLQNWKTLRDDNNRVYEKRRDLVVERLKAMKIHSHPLRATFYLWCEVPTKETSAEFCARILEETGVCFTPGTGFGKGGEGYFRISLTRSEVRLQEAMARLQEKLRL